MTVEEKGLADTVETMLKKMDKNGDGSVNRHGFIGGIQQAGILPWNALDAPTHPIDLYRIAPLQRSPTVTHCTTAPELHCPRTTERQHLEI